MNPLAIALQGIGFPPLLVSVHGFAPDNAVGGGDWIIRARRLGRR
jgi:hypothetical protein